MKWWQWPTVLSLDAPVIAVLWQRLLAGATHASVGLPQSFVLGASVWLAYAADRWIEGWRLDPDRIRTQRHRFYQRRRWPVAALWLVVLASDLGTALGKLSRVDLLAGLAVLGPVLLYIFSHQWLRRHDPARAPKEAWIATLLGAGVAVFIVSSPAAALSRLLIPLPLFVVLCFANCALISVWERDVDLSHGQNSLALQFGPAAGWSRRLPWILATVAGFVWLVTPRADRSAVACTAVSAALLGTIDLAEGWCGWRLARVLADAALLTPTAPLLLRALRWR